MPFDPSQPFEVVDGQAPVGFDPSQPFEVVEEPSPVQAPIEPTNISMTDRVKKFAGDTVHAMKGYSVSDSFARLVSGVNVQAKDYNQSLFEAADRRAQANLDSGKWDQNRFNQYMEKTRVGRSGSLAGQEEARNVHGFINAEIAEKAPKDLGDWQRALRNGVDSAVTIAPALAMSIFNPAAAGAYIFGSAETGSYADKVTDGASKKAATAAGIVDGYAEQIFEYLPTKFLGSVMKDGRLKNIIDFTVAEQAGEALTSLTNLITEIKTGTGIGKDWDKMTDEQKKDYTVNMLADTARTTLVGGGIQVGGAKVLQKTGELIAGKPKADNAIYAPEVDSGVVQQKPEVAVQQTVDPLEVKRKVMADEELTPEEERHFAENPDAVASATIEPTPEEQAVIEKSFKDAQKRAAVGSVKEAEKNVKAAEKGLDAVVSLGRDSPEARAAAEKVVLANRALAKAKQAYEESAAEEAKSTQKAEVSKALKAKKPVPAKTEDGITVFDQRLTEPKALNVLDGISEQWGWMEEGGKVIMRESVDYEGQGAQAVGRTKWVPNHPAMIPGYSQEYVAKAIAKAKSGEKLTDKQMGLVKGLLDYVEENHPSAVRNVVPDLDERYDPDYEQDPEAQGMEKTQSLTDKEPVDMDQIEAETSLVGEKTFEGYDNEYPATVRGVPRQRDVQRSPESAARNVRSEVSGAPGAEVSRADSSQSSIRKPPYRRKLPKSVIENREKQSFLNTDGRRLSKKGDGNERTEKETMARVEQWYSTMQSVNRGMRGVVSQEWSQPSNYESERGGKGFATEKSGREEQAKLIDAAKKNAFFFDFGHPLFEALDRYKNIGGAEHAAYIVGESPDQVVIRTTSKGEFGNTSKYSPVDYLKRIEDYNNTFPDLAIRMIGVHEDADGNAVIITAQPFIHGKEFETREDLDSAMRKKGWFEIGTKTGKYRHKDTGAEISDVHTGNVLYIGEDLFPIDVVVEKMPDMARLSKKSPIGFYSELLSAAEKLKQEKGTPEQMLSMLQKAGAKPAEIDATGLFDYLKLLGKSITKQQIVDYLEGNGVRVEETVLGDESRDSIESEKIELIEELNKKGYDFEKDFEEAYIVDLNNDREVVEIDDLPADVQQIANEIAMLHDADGELSGDTKFSNYVLPGGKSYRELLLTLPSLSKSDEARMTAIEKEMSSIVDPAMYAQRDLTKEENDRRVALSKEYGALSDKIRSRGEFSSGHFDQKNIISHVRLNERIDAEGKKVLFIEEIQSDWAQSGRKKGWKSDSREKALKRLEELNKTPDGDKTPEQWSEYHRVKNIAMTGDAGTVSPAPFVTSTDAWVSLAMKRMITYAAENGFDRVAWTTGEQQADRYDLSKEIDNIAYVKTGDGSYNVQATKGNSFVFNKNGIDISEVENTFGKEIAKKIEDDAGETNFKTGYRDLSGVDLKVGGEGMKAFYDSIVPKVAGKIIGKIGGKVSTINLPDEKQLGAAFEDLIDKEADSGNDVEVGSGEYYDLLGKARQLVEKLFQPGFDITPTMKAQVQEKGLPLFKKGTGKGFDSNELMDAIKKAAPHVALHVTVLNNMEELPADILAKMKKAGLAVDAYGMYDPGTKMAYIFSDATDSVENAIETALHEIAGHKALHLYLGRKGEKVYRDVFNSKDLARERFEVERKYKAEKEKFTKAGRIEDYQAWMGEEMLAEAAEKGKKPDIVQWAVARIRRLIREVFGLDYSINDVYALLADAGKSLNKAPVKAEKQDSQKLSKKDETETEAFKKWFGDSKVVDENGKPLVVYHGARESFDTFNLDMFGQTDQGEYGRGIYFTTNKDDASFYAGDTGSVMPVFLSIKNPKIMAHGGFGKNIDTNEIISQGYDGVIAVDGNGSPIEIVAFEPTQIKSAIGNQGTFDPSNPDIRLSKKVVEDAIDAEIPELSVDKKAVLKRRIKSGFNRWMTKEGGLPDSFFQAKMEGEGKQSMLIDIEARFQAARFRNAIEEAYGVPYRKLDAGQKEELNKALQGESAKISEKAKVAVQGMRDSLDALSDAMIKSQKELVAVTLQDKTPEQRKAYVEWLKNGADPEKTEGVPGEAVKQTLMAKKIESNKGSYLNRSYQAFDDPKWMEKVLENKPVIRAAYNLLKAEGDADPMATIKNMLSEAQEKASPMDFVATEGKRLGIFKRRKDISPEIRALLGEYKEPLLNYERSLSKMANIVSAHHALMSMRENGLKAGILSKTPTAERHVEIKGGERFSPLSGLYATPEVAQAIEDYSHKEVIGPFLRLLGWYNSLVKTGKTVYSPKTQARNLISNVALAVSNGHINPLHLAEAIKTAINETYRPAKMNRDFVGKLAERGVIHNAAINQELKNQINDALGGKEPSGMGRLLKIMADISQATYGLSDNIWKINGYLHELDRAKAKGITGEAAEKEAANRTVNVYPSNLIPRAMDKVRRLPVGPSFVSWPWEILRTTKNQAGYIAKDFKEGHYKDAAVRSVGNIAASAFFYSLAKASLEALGLDDEDDEALKMAQPPFRQNAMIYYYRDEKGNLKGTDLSAYDPRANIHKVVQAGMRGDGSPYEAIKEFLSPFLGIQIGTNALIEGFTGRDGMGNEIWNSDTDSDAEVAQKAIMHIVKNSEPGVASLLGDAYKSQAEDINPILEKMGWTWAMAESTTKSGRKYTASDAAKQLAGFSSFTTEPSAAAESLAYRYQEARAEASKDFMRTMTMGGMLYSSQIKKAVGEYKEDMKEARDPLRKYSKAITKGGLLKEGEIFATIAPIIGKDEAAYVLYDQPVILKNDRLNTIAEKTYERLMRDGKTKEEASAEIRRRLQGVTKEFYQK